MVIFKCFDFFFFPVMPGRPGIPAIHDNSPGYLILQWDEGANGNAPITKFQLQYRKGESLKTNTCKEFSTLSSTTLPLNRKDTL